MKFHVQRSDQKGVSSMFLCQRYWQS